MSNDSIQRHYGANGILDAILAGLRAAGKDLDHLRPADLAAVDEFHVRGREATIELAAMAGLAAHMRVLDVGCGIGGSARFLAAEYGCRVTGIDLTPEYIATARALTELVGLSEQVAFQQGSADALPFADRSFDLAWTEHVQMNVPDKRAFYGELARMLAPGGRLVFHDVFSGPGGPAHYPVPWASDASLSHLVEPAAARTLLDSLGLRVVCWQDSTERTRDWFAARIAKIRTLFSQPALGLHILLGSDAGERFDTLLRNLQEHRVTVIQAVLERP